MPLSKAKEMPLQLFLNFFINHGLFKLKNRPQWFTVTNRSRTYVNKVLENISGEIYKNYKISKIKRNDENVRLKIGHEYLDYDQVILATHADQSLKLLEDPTEQEKKILDKYKYVSNKAILHTDEMLMPKRKIAWSSWNSISKNNKTCVTYWLNNLQNLKSDVNYFLTLNPIYEVAKSKVIETVNFAHPYFNSETLKYQNELNSLQGIKRTWYCGAYFGYGFHEDGLNSAINLIKNFKI
jgi:predicted NAD/FAD-binding protein